MTDAVHMDAVDQSQLGNIKSLDRKIEDMCADTGVVLVVFVERFAFRFRTIPTAVVVTFT